MFPPVTNPADPNDQVGALLGNDTTMVVGNFDDVYAVGDRLLLAVYSGTVMQIPDFAISAAVGVHAGLHRRTGQWPEFHRLTQRRLQQHRDASPAWRRCDAGAIGHADMGHHARPAGHATRRPAT